MATQTPRAPRTSPSAPPTRWEAWSASTGPWSPLTRTSRPSVPSSPPRSTTSPRGSRPRPANTAPTQNPESNLRRIIAGSAGNDGGVNVIITRPGGPPPPLVTLPSGDVVRAAFLEEIPTADQAAYLAQNPVFNKVKLTPVDPATLALQADTTLPTVFRNDLTGKYFSSDLDAQFLTTVSGNKPANWGRSRRPSSHRCATTIATRPSHAASDNAIDVGQALFPKVSDFILKAQSPQALDAEAGRIANVLKANAANLLARDDAYLARLQSTAAASRVAPARPRIAHSSRAGESPEVPDRDEAGPRQLVHRQRRPRAGDHHPIHRRRHPGRSRRRYAEPTVVGPAPGRRRGRPGSVLRRCRAAGGPGDGGRHGWMRPTPPPGTARARRPRRRARCAPRCKKRPWPPDRYR